MELVGHHKFFHGLDHLQSLSLGLPLSSFSHVVLEETAIMCAAGENAMHVSGDPGYTEPSAFLSFLQGCSYKLFAWSCHG